MRLGSKLCGLLCVLGGAVTSATGAARPLALSNDYIRRPLVLPEHVARVDAGPRWPDYDGQWKHVLGTDSHVLNPGFSLGVVKDLEVGGVIPVRVSPNVQLENPRAYALYQVQTTSVAYGVFGQLQPIFRGDGIAVLTGGVPFLWSPSPKVRLDFGPFVDFVLGDNGSSLNILLPLSLPYQITSQVFAGVETAFNMRGVFDEGRGIQLPVGGFAGYTLAGPADILFRARTTDIQNGVDQVELMLAFEYYFGM